MRWGGMRESGQVEDRRGFGGAGLAIGGGGLLAVVVVSFLLGQNPLQVLNTIIALQEGATPQEAQAPTGPIQDTAGKFVAVVLADTEDTWKSLFQERGRAYQEPTLVLFDGVVRSSCGMGSAAVGPFYCPSDGKIYLDLTFFKELEHRFGAPGDFGSAYVIAHEVGHHVQNLLGIARPTPRHAADANAQSVRIELQADCLAGVWGHHAQRHGALIEAGDFEEGLGAAAAIGDDRLQRMSQGHVQPESWTHGSSEQRKAWLRRGLESGNPDTCDTAAAVL